MTENNSLSKSQLTSAALYGSVALLFASSAYMLYKSGKVSFKAQPATDNLASVLDPITEPESVFTRMSNMMPSPKFWK